MTEQPRFDPARSDAIRSLLIDQVESAPRRDHRRHVRIAVAAVLAAIGVTFGGAAVAVALTGGTLFGTVESAPVVTASAPANPDATPTPTPTGAATPTPTPHPLVVADGFVPARDVLTAPAAPKWTLDLPGDYDGCEAPTPLDVGDGFALITRGPSGGSDEGQCRTDSSRFSLSLVDTSSGDLLWSRDWSWPYDPFHFVDVHLLGTSGRVLVWSTAENGGPREVLDLKTGQTLGAIALRPDFRYTSLFPVDDDSGQVTFVAQQTGGGADAGSGGWVAMRADPLALEAPVWSRPVGANASTLPVIGASSLMTISAHADDYSTFTTTVLDVDSGAVMVDGATDRSYFYYDGFALRETDFNPLTLPRTVAGVDDAGNEIWRRSLDSGYYVLPVMPEGIQSSRAVNFASKDVVLSSAGNRLEYIEGATGATLWTADASACATQFNAPGPGMPMSVGFGLAADGVVVSYDSAATDGVQHGVCGFDRATGAPVDVSTRVKAALQGPLATYGQSGGKFSAPTPDGTPSIGTAYDSVTGATLWSIPTAEDERWQFAGGYLIGMSGNRLTGIG